jgi:hypothetical protein
VHRYTTEQHEFFRESAPGRSYNELHDMFLAKFGINLTAAAVKSYMKNHKLKTETYRKYTQEHIDWLRENIQGTRFRDLTRMFNEHFAFNIGIAAMVSLCDRFGLHNGIDARFNPAMVNAGVPHRFPKGHVPANKGRKGVNYPGMQATQFKKGNMPQTWKPVGTENLRSDGYVWVKIAEPHKWREKHVLAWEAAHGPRPAGHKIIFGDGNRQNFELDNLLLVTNAQLVRMNQNGLIGGSADLTRAGILVADIMSKVAERKRGRKKRKHHKKEDLREMEFSHVKTTHTITLIGWTVRGVDRRTGGPFEAFIPMETSPSDPKLLGMKERIKATYGLLGFDVSVMEREDTREFVIDLNDLWDNGKLPAPLSPQAQAVIEAPFDKMKEPDPEPDPDHTFEEHHGGMTHEMIQDPPTPLDESEPSEDKITYEHVEEDGAKKISSALPPELLETSAPPHKGGRPRSTPLDRQTGIDGGPASKKKGISARLDDYIRQHGADGCKQIINAAPSLLLTEDEIRDVANGKAKSGRWWQAIGKVLDSLELPADKPAGFQPEEMNEYGDELTRPDNNPEPPATKTPNKGAPPPIWNQGPDVNGLGVIDEDKLRRKTQAALIHYCAKHGSDLKPVVRATKGRVTEDTVKAILADCNAGRLVYVQAVDTALKKLAVADAGRASDSRGYDMT